MAKLLIITGAILIAMGLLWLYFPQALNWFGKLPGDIAIKKANGGFYFPLTSMIVISLLLSLLLAIINRF